MSQCWLQFAVLGALTGLLGGPPLPANDSLKRMFPPQSADVPQSAQAGAPAAYTAPATVQAILVFPFEDQSRVPSLEWLGEGLAELTVARLDGGSRFVFSREDRLDALERMGLPGSAQFSVATMIEIGREVGADDVVYGAYTSDAKAVTVSARILRLNSPKVSDALSSSGPLTNLLAVDAQLAGSLVCALDSGACPGGVPPRDAVDANRPPSSLAAFQLYIRAITGPADDQRLHDLRDAARLEPDWDLPAFELGLEDFERRDCESALVWFSRVPPDRPRGVEASFDAGVCHLFGNDANRAASSFQDVLDEKPLAGADPPEVHNDLGVALLRLGKFADAAGQFERATQGAPDAADFFFNLGIARFLAGDAVQAQADLHRAQSLAPDDAGIRDAITEIAAPAPAPPAPSATKPGAAKPKSRADDSSSDAAAAAWIVRARIAPHLDRAWLRPGGNATESAAGQQPADAPQQSVMLHLERGQQFLLSGDLDDAQRAFTEAQLVAPYDAAAHRGLAEVYRRQGRPEDALRELSAAISNLNDAATHVEMAQLLIEMNRAGDARDQLRQALAIEPANEQAHQLLDKLDGGTQTGGTP